MYTKMLIGLSALLATSTAHAQSATVPCNAQFYTTSGTCGAYSSTTCVDVTGNYFNTETNNAPRTVQVDVIATNSVTSSSAGTRVASEPITIKGQQVQGNVAFKFTTAFPAALWQNGVSDGMTVSCSFNKFN